MKPMEELKQFSEPVQITIIVCATITFIAWWYILYRLLNNR